MTKSAMKSVFLLLAGIQGVYCLSTAREITGKKGTSVTVPCQYSSTYAFFTKYLCQGREFVFCSILKYNTHEQKVGDKVQIMDHEHETIFYITIRDLNEGDQAWYWCGIEIHGGIDQGFYFYLYVTNGNAGLSLTNNLLKGSEGQHLGIICDYDPSFITNNKRICHGTESYNCRNIENGNNDHVHVEDKPLQRKFIVTLKDLKKTDSGWYWIIMGSKDTERISFYIIVEDSE
uniref:Immunoglobulin domain-containing protein n=1 Tax=Erpetoichthys calabaricus TaxID=27687 RepID=A0A8C4SGY1_ERPCA